MTENWYEDDEFSIYCVECGSCGDLGCCLYACDHCIDFDPEYMKRVILKNGKQRITYKEEEE